MCCPKPRSARVTEFLHHREIGTQYLPKNRQGIRPGMAIFPAQSLLSQQVYSNRIARTGEIFDTAREGNTRKTKVTTNVPRLISNHGNQFSCTGAYDR